MVKITSIDDNSKKKEIKIQGLLRKKLENLSFNQLSPDDQQKYEETKGDGLFSYIFVSVVENDCKLIRIDSDEITINSNNFNPLCNKMVSKINVRIEKFYEDVLNQGNMVEDGLIYVPHEYDEEGNIQEADDHRLEEGYYLHKYTNKKEDVELSYDKKGFMNFLNDNKLFFDSELVENFLLSLKVKPFVIFTGNSGTGKTKLALEFAKFIEAEKVVLPVGSNWTDNRNILGYYNPITQTYNKTPVLSLIEKANYEDPYFLILDEMNLSHVERYFADFLSAIESGESIPLNNYEKESINVPYNFFTVGTVNVDETTYMFSPKVLDRANTIEFKTMGPKKYLDIFEEYIFLGNEDFLLNPLAGVEVRTKYPSDFRYEWVDVKVGNSKLWNKMVDSLEDIFNILSKANFDFGFRVINEIFRFIYVAWVYEEKIKDWDNWERYFDAQILQKILPRIHGSGKTLLDTLIELKKHCNSQGFSKSEEKLDEMCEVLKTQKFVSFIN